jgi:tRNA A-37 threonylcarbamoyl transferase component Bud32
MEYAGESLYHNFTLPNNWQDQINDIFDELDNNKINYSEFWLQNILVLDNKITLVDYGLAKFNSDIDNSKNRKFFIDNLKALSPKLSIEQDRNTRLRLIRTFFDNLKNQ